MLSARSNDPSALTGPLYLVALLLVFTPMLDFLSGIQPLALDNIQWRFGAVGLLSGFLLTPLLGVVLAIVVAQFAGHGLVQRILAVVNLLVVAVFLAVLVAFLLDVVQLHDAVQEEAMAQFRSAAWKAIAKHLAFLLVLTWLGVAGIGLSRRPLRADQRSTGTVVVSA